MTALPAAKLYKIVGHLPPESLGELQAFAEYLRFKAKSKRPARKLARLGGLWKDVPFDVTSTDVRSLRHQISQQVLKEA